MKGQEPILILRQDFDHRRSVHPCIKNKPTLLDGLSFFKIDQARFSFWALDKAKNSIKFKSQTALVLRQANRQGARELELVLPSGNHDCRQKPLTSEQG
ncbi:hypothetical protein WN943_009021 [Citrus x changshan-huyou]